MIAMVHFVNTQNNISCLFKRRQPNTNAYCFQNQLFKNSLMSIQDCDNKVSKNYREYRYIYHGTYFKNSVKITWFTIVSMQYYVNIIQCIKNFAKRLKFCSRTNKCICNRKLPIYSIDQFVNSTFVSKSMTESNCSMKVLLKHTSYKKYFAQYENGYLFFLSYIE